MTRSALSEYRRSVLEDDLLTTVLEAAAIYGWRVHHDRRSDKALQQGNPGFPDLCMVRAGRVIFAELKREGEHPTQEQWAWIKELPMDSHTINTMVVRPSNVDELLRLLR